jgi:hypothetical protein
MMMTERKYPTRDSGPMYNFPMPTETLRAELAEAKGMIDAALRLHTPERRYTTADGDASWDTAEDCASDSDIPFEAVEHFDVCTHCGSIEVGDDSDRDYRESLFPCDTAKALGVTE